MVGDGPERETLTAQAKRLNIEGRITFKGWTDKSVLLGIYREADIFVLPSRDEGMANVLLEAMASGLPIIGTDVAGTSEVMINNKTGLLVPSESATALASAIISLVDSSSRRETYGRAARERIEASYSWTSTAVKWSTVLENVIAAKGPM